MLFSLVAAVALVAAGCGSKKKGPYQSSKADFAAALNSICKAGKAKQDAITITSLADLAAKGPQEVAIFKDEVAQLKKLGTPPDEIKTQVEDIIAKAGPLEDLFNQLIDAAKTGDTAKVQQVEAKIKAADKETDPDFTAIGAPACLSTA